MRLATSSCLGVIVAASLAGSARPQETDDSLKIYGVYVDRTPKQSWTGLGIYLGQGIVLIPAHVSGLGLWRKPRVEIAGKIYPTKVLKDGHFHRVDLTLLSVDVNELPVSLGLRRMPLCQEPSRPGQPVVILTQENVVRSFVIPSAPLPVGYNTAVKSVPDSGGSGSGVIDANKRCLVGMITRTIAGAKTSEEDGRETVEPVTVAKYFIPASEIVSFLPSGLRY